MKRIIPPSPFFFGHATIMRLYPVSDASVPDFESRQPQAAAALGKVNLAPFLVAPTNAFEIALGGLVIHLVRKRSDLRNPIPGKLDRR